MDAGSEGTPPPAPRDYFATTRWSVVLAAGRKSSPDSERALAELCRQYWYPLYAYVRRRGHGREDAEDLVQGFFARLLERDALGGLDAGRGKFRAYLLATLKNFLANEWDRSRAQKRGGGVEHLSLDWQAADERYHLEPPDRESPDVLFDRAWALALLGRVIDRLRDECAADGRAALFAVAKEQLTAASDTVTHAELGASLGMTEGAARVAVHRLRKRYRELLRDEIAQTLADPEQVADELRSLASVLAG